jgi:hypothetical protein
MSSGFPKLLLVVRGIGSAFSSAIRDMNEAVMHGTEAPDKQPVRSAANVPAVLVNPDPDGQWFIKLLFMRKQQKKIPDSEPLVTLYEKTGKRMYFYSLVCMALDTVILKRGLTDLIADLGPPQRVS